MIAAWQLVPSTRNRIADPGLWSTNVEPFTNKDTARRALEVLRPRQGDRASRRCAATRSRCAQPGMKTASVELRASAECIAHGYDANQAASVPRRGNDGVHRRATPTATSWSRRRRSARGAGIST